MLNISRIKLMTALAMYETGEGKKDLKICSYNKRDYVSLHLLTTIILVTIAYLVCVGIAGIVFLGIFAGGFNLSSFYGYGIVCGVIYIVLLIICIIYANVYFGKKYVKAKAHVKSFYKGLRHMQKMYQGELQAMENDKTIAGLRKQIEGDRNE